ncbi:MAG TPA: hypothetical protein VKA86_12360 [Candidatus Krumholzibacteria bacterium]|nr:hypothetical protein [Candidatus Krumholzibacteria bacterium]
MSVIKLFYNGSCGDCDRMARRTRRLDWLGRIELSTDLPPCGPLDGGEIAVVHTASGRVHTGIEATREVCMHVPLYVPYGLLLHIPLVRRFFGRGRTRGGGACNRGIHDGPT